MPDVIVVSGQVFTHVTPSAKRCPTLQLMDHQKITAKIKFRPLWAFACFCSPILNGSNGQGRGPLCVVVRLAEKPNALPLL